MSDIRIEVFNGAYDNDDAYNKVLGYVSNKSYWGGYGFSYNSDVPIIDQFQLSEMCSEYENDQKVWHFIITFSYNIERRFLLNMATEVSLKFASDYQVLFGLDTEMGNGKYSPHLHFAVNAFSYHPHREPLTKERMKEYMVEIQKFLSDHYTCNITLQFQGKRSKHSV